MENNEDLSPRHRDCPGQHLNACSKELQNGPADEAQEATSLLCQFCLDNDLLRHISQFSLGLGFTNTSGAIYAYGSIEELQSRQTCPFCRLVNRLMPLDLPSATQIQVRPRLEHSQDRRLDIYAGKQFQRSVEIVHRQFDTRESTVLPKIEPAEICGYLQCCENDHDHSRLSSSRLYHTPIDLTFISVAEGRLVRGSTRDRYFALSYVWGEVSMFQTTMLNRSSFEEPGSLTSIMEKIPSTIQDSIALMQVMGERYLWVDSLCIEQDNKSQKHTQILQMDSIYSQAVATIVAVSSLNAASGLPGVRKDSLLPSSSSETIYELGIGVKANAPHIIEYIASTCYESRAWTFQERLLSKRCLLFTNTGTYFHCSEGLINIQDGQLQVFEAQFNTLPDCLLTKPGYRSNWASAFPGYVGLVRNYTKRHLSYSSDALNAFSGLLELFKHKFDGKIISGLPSRILDAALLWVPVENHCTRNLNFPSWAWAGWIGPVKYWPPLTYSLTDGCNSNSKRSWNTKTVINLTRPLKSAITQFHLSGQPIQREIDENLSKIPPLASSAGDPPELRSYSGKEINRRNVLEFNALTVNIARIPTHQMSAFGKGYHSRKDFKGVCGAVISSDRDLKNFEQHSTDLVLLSQFSPLSLSEKYKDTREIDPDRKYFDENVFEIREWCLLNLMIVSWDAKRDFAERVGLCVLHEDVWNKLNPRMKRINLT